MIEWQRTKVILIQIPQKHYIQINIIEHRCYYSFLMGIYLLETRNSSKTKKIYRYDNHKIPIYLIFTGITIYYILHDTIGDKESLILCP